MNFGRLKGPLGFLSMAVVLAAIVAYVAYAYLQQREQRIKEEITAKAAKSVTPKVTVAVPKADAKEGTEINLVNFVSREIDADLVYPDTILAKNFNNYQGQKLARPILRGRPLQITDLVEPEVKDVASTLPKGLRALTIEIDNLNSIAETLRPGNRVDLFLISKAIKPIGSELPDQAFEQATVFLQNLQVIATGQEFKNAKSLQESNDEKMVRPGQVQGAQKRGFDTVTVLVDPRTAAKILIGQKMGSYRAVLRPKDDIDDIKMVAVRSGDFLPLQPPKPEGIEFIAGGKGGGSENLVTTISKGSVSSGLIGRIGSGAATEAALKKAIDQVRNIGRTSSLAPITPNLPAEQSAPTTITNSSK